MADRRGHPGLVVEHVDERNVIGEMRMDPFERHRLDEPASPEGARDEHLAHPPCGKALDDLVAPQAQRDLAHHVHHAESTPLSHGGTVWYPSCAACRTLAHLECRRAAARYKLLGMATLLAALTELQHEVGWLRPEDLAALAEKLNVPLYRLEGLVSFYPHFRRTPPPEVEVLLCRDVSCRLAGGPGWCAEARQALAGRLRWITARGPRGQLPRQVRDGAGGRGQRAPALRRPPGAPTMEDARRSSR